MIKCRWCDWTCVPTKKAGGYRKAMERLELHVEDKHPEGDRVLYQSYQYEKEGSEDDERQILRDGWLEREDLRVIRKPDGPEGIPV